MRLATLSRVLHEKLTITELVKKFPAFYGTPMFITVVTTARHLSLSWTRSIRYMPSHFLYLRCTVILTWNLTPVYSRWTLSPRFLLFIPRATCAAHLIPLDLNTWVISGEEYIHETLYTFFSSFLVTSSMCSRRPSCFVLPVIWETKCHLHMKQQEKLHPIVPIFCFLSFGATLFSSICYFFFSWRYNPQRGLYFRAL